MPSDRAQTVPLISQSSSVILQPFLGIESFTNLGVSSKISWWLGELGSFLTIENDEARALPTSLFLPKTPSRLTRASLTEWQVDGVLLGVSRVLRTPYIALHSTVIRAPASVEDDLRAQIGCGAGLTPEGDDELAGFLIVARALGISHSLDRSEWKNERTTTFSAALLDAALHGFAISVVADAAREIAVGSMTSRTQEALLAVGHSSGEALLRGMETAQQCFRRAA
jgi:Protein of unknown function (DUF2877)